jgi:hypothetical protein
MNKFGGRKFIFALYAFSVASILVACAAIDATTFQFIATAIITGYLAANVTQKVFTKEPQ